MIARIALGVVLIITLCLPQTFAVGAPQSNQLMDYLGHQQQATNQALKQLAELKQKADEATAEEIKRTKLLIQVNDNNLQHYQQLLATTNEVLKKTIKQQTQVESLQVNPSFPHREHAEEWVEKLLALKAKHKQIKSLLEENIRLSHTYGSELNDYLRASEQHYARKQYANINELLKKKNASIEEENRLLYQLNMRFEDAIAKGNVTIATEVKLNLLNLRIRLNEIAKTIVNIERSNAYGDYLIYLSSNKKVLNKSIDVFSANQSSISEMQAELAKLLSLLAENKKVISENEKKLSPLLEQEYQKLETKLKKGNEELGLLSVHTQEMRVKAEQKLKKIVAKRQDVFQLEKEDVASLIAAFVNFPHQFSEHLMLLYQQVSEKFELLSMYQKAFIYILIALGVGWIFAGRFILARYKPEPNRLSGHILKTALLYLQRNRIALITTIVMLAIFTITNTPFQNYKLLVYLLLTWLGFKAVIDVLRASLLDRVSDTTGHDVRLYHRLKYILIFGAMVTGLLVTSSLLNSEAIMQDFFARLFMLFLLVLAIILYRHKEVIPNLLRPMLRRKRKYVKTTIKVLSVLIPLTLFINAVTGLIGYVNLAWMMSYYQAVFVLIVTAYILIRGVATDGLDLLSEWMIKNLANGWLWTEVLLKPLDLIMRITLFLASIVTLFLSYGLDSDSVIVGHMMNIFNYPLVHNVSGVHITPKSILEFVILLAVFVWSAKWAREFCYRWLYRDIRDNGIRNSMAAFTQYALILLGTIITLRVLGIEFSGMSFVLGGLAVGMGFGLRDFASNVIGGLMLLIERPVREGDFISMGQYEGRVAHIGIRSMRVRSWDNMEVLIPNAETFNKPFANWTHQDSVVRTVVPIKLQRQDDPVKIQQLIFEVLAIIPEVLQTPSPQVYLKQIDDVLIEFEVRYFINIAEHSRVETRSKVLFGIMSQFKAAGVKPPVNQYNVELLAHDNKAPV